MHTIAIINAKGGAGKTTLALHLAVADVQQGRNVAVLDLDPQGTAAGWGERRGSSAPVVLATAPSRLGAEQERVAGAGADVLYLDTPPRWAGADTAARVAASAADLMVVPMRPSFVDLEATVATLERIQAVTAARVVAVLNGCATRGSDADDAEQALADRGVEVCPVRDRSARSVRSVATHRPGRAGIGADREGGRRDSARACCALCAQRAQQGDTMSKFTDTLKAPAAPGRAGPATRQGRKHVGVYVLPDVAHRLRVLAAVESTSTASAHRAGYRDALSVARQGGQVGGQGRRESAAMTRV